MWIAWMGNWQYAGKLPALPGRGEMTVARSLFLVEPDRTRATRPGQEPLLLVQRPVLSHAVLQALDARCSEPRLTRRSPRPTSTLPSRSSPAASYLLRVTLDPGDAAEAGLRLRRSTTTLTSRRAKRPSSASTPQLRAHLCGPNSLRQSRLGAGVSRAHLGAAQVPQANSIRLEIVVDHNSIEVFAEDGRRC
jgi:fructan beta-fructosidase